MHAWISEQFFPHFEGAAGFEKTYEAAFFAARQDGVAVLEMNIDVTHRLLYNGSVTTLIEALEGIHQRIAPEIRFIPEIGFNRYTDARDLLECFIPYLDTDYFQSIDLYATEFAQPIENFREIYQLAKEHGMKRKAHIGEFGPAKSIIHAVETLDLTAIQHGIAAAESPHVMAYLRERQIPLHICPTSNVRLGRVEAYAVHPIRMLFDQGVIVTINTDDIAIFDTSVSEEYVHLLNAKLFSASELNEIRENGLSCDA
jgi:adenosine deaminase